MIRVLIPLDATDAERADIERDLGTLLADLQDGGGIVVVSVESTPDGDVFTLRLDDETEPR